MNPEQQHTIHFKPKGKPVKVAPGTTILEAAIEGGIKLRHNCGGHATCGTCRVHIKDGIDNLSPIVKREITLLGEERLDNHYRLACQSKVRGDVVVEVPNWYNLLPRIQLDLSDAPENPDNQDTTHP